MAIETVVRAATANATLTAAVALVSIVSTTVTVEVKT